MIPCILALQPFTSCRGSLAVSRNLRPSMNIPLISGDLSQLPIHTYEIMMEDNVGTSMILYRHKHAYRPLYNSITRLACPLILIPLQHHTSISKPFPTTSRHPSTQTLGPKSNQKHLNSSYFFQLRALDAIRLLSGGPRITIDNTLQCLTPFHGSTDGVT